MASLKGTRHRNASFDVRSTIHLLQDNVSIVLTLAVEESSKHQDLHALIVMHQSVIQDSQLIPTFQDHHHSLLHLPPPFQPLGAELT